MSTNSRDNFKGTIIKFFILALLILFIAIGAIKQLIYGHGSPFKRSSLPSVAGGLSV